MMHSNLIHYYSPKDNDQNNNNNNDNIFNDIIKYSNNLNNSIPANNVKIDLPKKLQRHDKQSNEQFICTQNNTFYDATKYYEYDKKIYDYDEISNESDKDIKYTYECLRSRGDSFSDKSDMDDNNKNKYELESDFDYTPHNSDRTHVYIDKDNISQNNNIERTTSDKKRKKEKSNKESFLDCFKCFFCF
jgi:hypothetical protein